MCQYWLTKKGRKCGRPTEPYCYLHKPKDGQEVTTSSSSPVAEDCFICTETRKEFVTHSVCNNKTCSDCVIRTGKKTCSFCRGDMTTDIPESLLSLLDFVGEKDRKIRALEVEILSLRRSILMLQLDSDERPRSPPRVVEAPSTVTIQPTVISSEEELRRILTDLGARMTRQ